MKFKTFLPSTFALFILMACSGDLTSTGKWPTITEGLEATSPLSDSGRQEVEYYTHFLGKSLEGPALEIDYPEDSSVFPQELVAPTFVWSNPGLEMNRWLLKIDLKGGKSIRILKASEGPPPFNIDSSAIPDNAPLRLRRPLTMESWTPDSKIWKLIKKHSIENFNSVTITGFSGRTQDSKTISATIRLKVSKDPVGAPIFYRDVPFMPISDDRRGKVLPLDNFNLRYIKWKLRDLSRESPKTVLTDMVTCANCHNFSQTGKRLAMDIDGTQGDKGAYGIKKISKKTVYERKDIISWNYDFKEKQRIKPTFGFLSALSPDGRKAVTTVNEELFIVGYIDQAFLQVFYPTRGQLAWWSEENGEVQTLPGADDPNFVHCSPTWTPDGQYIIYSRAKAKDPFTRNQKMPAKANDPEETPIQYSLYRIPFNNGQGGKAEPIRGASYNGKSNSFSKVTPDGKFVVYVQSRNGLLMRPDSKLWIVPIEGGKARYMRCNTWRMNSWHSFSPNGRWMVFSSKRNSIYTQLFLTHIDSNGNDTPPILIPNSTADNRASNLPEFAPIHYDELDTIEVPAISHFAYRARAHELIDSGIFPKRAIELLEKALDEEPQDRIIRSDIMLTLGMLEKDPLKSLKRIRQAMEADSTFGATWIALCHTLNSMGRQREAIEACRTAIAKRPDNYIAMNQLTTIYLTSPDSTIKNLDSAQYWAAVANDSTYWQNAISLQNLARTYSEKGDFSKAVEMAELGIQRAEEKRNNPRAEAIHNELNAYRRNMNFLSIIKRNQ